MPFLLEKEKKEIMSKPAILHVPGGSRAEAGGKLR